MLLKPSALIFAALLIGIVLAWRGRHRAGRRWITGAVVALAIAGFSPLSDVLIHNLEDRFPRPDLAGTNVDGIVVLGGAEDSTIGTARNVIFVKGAAERYIEAAMLALRFPKARVVLSGGPDTLRHTEPEAVAAGRMLQALGISRDRLTIEGKSLTTWENAKLSAPLIDRKPGERWLLVTAGWHMPRAIGAFRKAGLALDAYPVDYRTTGSDALWRFHTSLTDGLQHFDNVVREYPGLLVYWLTGRSSALFPAP